MKAFDLENVEVIDLTVEGFGVFRFEGQVGFITPIAQVVPGDIVNINVYKVKKNTLQARLISHQSFSESRIKPICRHFGACGGCQLQHLDYFHQLAWKEKFVYDALTRIGKINLPEDTRPIIGHYPPHQYRNKLEYSFSNRRWLSNSDFKNGQLDPYAPVLGFHAPAAYDKIVDVQSCHLQDDKFNEVRNYIKNFAVQSGLSFYNSREQSGFWRTLIFRNAFFSNESMLILATGTDDKKTVLQLSHLIQQFYTFISTFIWIYNPKKNDSFQDLPYEVVYGKGFIEEILDTKRFKISPKSFFQTNPKQTLHLYRLIKSFIPDNTPHLYDLYCGTGSIGIFCAEKVKRVTGIEYSVQAIADAQVNADLNGLNHLDFFAGDVQKLLSSEFITKHGKPDCIVVDPPRAGLHTVVIEQLLKIAPSRIIYVSCNASTQARDLILLCEKYKLTTVQPIDLFPQTTHVENIAVLDLK